MKRPLSLVAALLAALFVVLPASAGHAPPFRAFKGSITALTSDGVVVAGAHGGSATCAFGRHSPSTSGYSVGDRVQMLCVRSHHQLLLARIRHLQSAGTTATGSADSAPTLFGGAITSLTDTQISLHDGNRDFTCTLGPSSPSTSSYTVGQHVKVACAGGNLVAIAPIGPADLGRYFVGTVTTIGDTSLTIQTEHGAVTCTIGAGSPSLASLQVGEKIGMGCKASTMQLVLLRPLGGDSGGSGTGSTPPPPPPTSAPPTNETGGQGPIATLTDGSISVTTDGGTVTCTIGSSSPGTSGFQVGDQVRISCLDGVLHEITTVDGDGL